MNDVIDSRQKSYEDNKNNIDRIIMAAIGGACLGGSLYTNIGAIVGGLLGAIAGAARNDEIAKNNEIKRLRNSVNG
ncbi:hypothetical protein HY792_02250 [Candidatus Desantisbacteria bacterium]|nr:hypothetical protein [Candidatus Desantisbacteria bacterium]